jgi:hypothetical protein
MIDFLKYLVYRFGNKLFWFGLVIAVLMVCILVDQAAFYVTAIEVDATVQRVDSTCSLEWKEQGHKMSVDIDCAQARAIQAFHPSMDYRVIDNTRTQLAYAAPDGTPMTQWSHIAKFEGHELARGDRLIAAVNANDYSDIRHRFDAADMMLGFAILYGSIVATIVGWVVRSAGRGYRLPGPIWTWRRSS